MAENVAVRTFLGLGSRKSASSWTNWTARARQLDSHRLIVLVLVALFLAGTYSPAFQRVEGWFYDVALQLLPTGKLSSSVVVVAVDDEALQRVGPWPWPRDSIARTIDRLQRLKARTVGLMVPLSRAETPAGLDKLVEEATASRKLAATAKKWAARLDTDKALQRAMSNSGRVVIAAEYGEQFESFPPILADQALKVAPSGWRLASLLHPFLVGPGGPPVAVHPPLQPFLSAAAGLGVVEDLSEGGERRSVPLAVSTGEYRLPHLITRLAAMSRAG